MFLLYYQICLYCPYYGMHIHKKLLTTNRQKGTLGNKSNFKTAATSGYSYYMKALRVVQYINPPTNCLHCISQQQNQNCSGLGPTACSEVEGIKGHLSPFLSPKRMFSDGGRKPEDPERIHTEPGRTCKPPRPPGHFTWEFTFCEVTDSKKAPPCLDWRRWQGDNSDFKSCQTHMFQQEKGGFFASKRLNDQNSSKRHRSLNKVINHFTLESKCM